MRKISLSDSTIYLVSGVVSDSIARLSGLRVQKLMGHGSLVPDALILRLITNELTTRGWLKDATSVPPRTVNASAASAEMPSPMPPVSEEEATEGDEFSPSPRHLTANNSPSASYILDGFPRTSTQAAALDALVPINMVAHIATPTSIILDRIVNRWVHAPSGRIYNTTFNPPKVSGLDDITGEPLTRRDDDSEEVWTTRLRKFEETSRPLLDHYDNMGVLWKVQGHSSDEISPKLFKEVERRFGLFR